MSNESEAFAYFERAQNILIRQSQLRKSFRGRSSVSVQGKAVGDFTGPDVNEKEVYGDNTACAVVILSLSADGKGQILHANDEITRVLGFHRKTLLGCNVNILQPKPFSQIHDRLLKRFLDTSKRSLINHSRQSFAKTESDYLVPVQLLIKLYPMMTDKITVIGMIQALQKIDGLDGGGARMESTASSGLLAKSYDLEDQSARYKIHHYIMTDQEGNVTCVSEGLSRETGLNKKLFIGMDGFSTSFNIKRIFHSNFQLEESEDAMLNSPEGFETHLITEQVINDANTEFLAPEEIEDMKRKIGQYHVNVMHRIIDIDPNIAPVDFYRVILLPPNIESIKQSRLSSQPLRSGQQTDVPHQSPDKNSSDFVKSDAGRETDSTGFNAESGLFNGSASVSSTTSGHSRSTGTSVTMSKVIQEFKNSISRRETPKHLIRMGRLLGLVILATIAISCFDFEQKMLYASESFDLCAVLTHTHQRHTQQIQLVMNIRSLVNLANHYEDEIYQSQNLSRIDRFQYIGYLIEKQSQYVQDSHNHITQNRATFLSEELSKKEKRQDNLYRLTPQMTVSNDAVPFRFAMNDYLNVIMQLPEANMEALKMQSSIIRGSPIIQLSLDDINGTRRNYTPSLIQRDLYFMLANGIRTLRIMNEEAVDYIRDLTYDITENHFIGTFLAIMIAGIIVSSCSLFLILFQLMQTKKSKVEILNLIAMISINDIKYAYDSCDNYIDRFENLDESLYCYQFDKKREITAADFANQANNQGKNSAQELKLKDPIKRGGTANAKIPKGQQLDGEQLEEPGKEGQNFNSTTQSNYQILLKKNPMNYNEGISSDEHYKRLFNLANDAMRDCILTGSVRKSDQVMKNAKGRKTKEVNDDDSIEEVKDIVETKKKYRKRGDDYQKDKLKQSRKTIKGKAQSKEEFNEKKEIGVTKNKKQQQYLAKRFDVPNQSFLVDGSQDEINVEQDCTHIADEDDDDQDAEPIRGHHGSKGGKRGSALPTDTSIGGKHHSKEHEDDSHDDIKNGHGSLSEEQGNGHSMERTSLAQRKSMLTRSSRDDKRVFMRMILYNCASMLIFYVYFIYVYVFHEVSLNRFQDIQDFTPHLFNRYNSLFLSYELLREKIINNRTAFSVLDIQVPQMTALKMHGLDIDEYYHEDSIQTERDIQQMLLLAPSSVQPLLELELTTDSKDFCEATFGSIQIQGETGMVPMSRSEEKRVRKIRNEAYALQIVTVVAAIRASQEGNISKLQELKDEKVNLDSADYDKRTALHAACAAGQYQAVKFLLENGVHPNPTDRWGATPLDDAFEYPEIKQFMVGYGAKNGVSKAKNVARGKVSISDNQYKGFFSAYYNNVTVLDDLRKLGWSVNAQDINGRTFLSVASSQGHLESVQFLITHGANMNLKGLRGNDALDDAIREGRTKVIKYLSDEALVQNYCFFFEDGLLDNGIKQVIGVLNKKFADTQIAIRAANNYTQLLSLLKTTVSNNSKVQTGTIELFINVQELYLHKVTEEITTALEQTYDQYNTEYTKIVEEVFFIFLAFQLVSLIYLRKRQIDALRDDVMQTRGLLGLVPEAFFKEHQNEVGNAIKIMQS